MELEKSLEMSWDFPDGPMVKNPPADAGDAGSIPGPGTKIPCAVGAIEPAYHKREASTPRQKIPSATTKTGRGQK